MTIPKAESELCQFCGFLHAPDFSDIRNTTQSWIEPVCRLNRPKMGVPPRVPAPQEVPDRKVEAAVLPAVLHVKFMRAHGYAMGPAQAYRHDAGWDLEICEPATLLPGKWTNLRTGLIAAIPEGYWGHILARSSTWRHKAIRVEPAVIDASYRGELMVYAVNTQKESQEVKVGDRLAQIIILPLPNVEWVEQGRLPPGERGERGYGSSGT